MPFRFDDPVHLNARLCNVEIIVPSQLPEEDGSFPAYVTARFGTTVDRFQLAKEVRDVKIGLHSATLRISTCDQSQIDPMDRYRSEPIPFKFDSVDDASAQTSSAGKVSGTASIPLLNKILSLAAEGEKGKATQEGQTTKLTVEAEFTEREIRTLTNIDWIMEHLNPARPVPHFRGEELYQQPLCRIIAENGEAVVTVSISIVPGDLYLEATPQPGALLEDASNEEAVLMALATQSEMSVQAPLIDPPPDQTQTLTIAAATVTRTQPKDPS